MIKLKSRTKSELEKLLEISLVKEEADKASEELSNINESFYAVEDEVAWENYQKAKKKYEEDRKKIFYSNMNRIDRKAKLAELRENYPSMPNRFIPENKKEEYNNNFEKIRVFWAISEQKLKEIKKQKLVVMQTFVDEYGLSERYAEVVNKANKNNKKLYHNPSFSGKQLNLQTVCQNMAEGKFNLGNFELNEAGVALYFGDLTHTKNYYFSEDAKELNRQVPENIIEVSVKPTAKIYKIGLKQYLNHPGEEYKQYFTEEDFELLNNVQRKAQMHLRCIFDVAMGYDACVRIHPENDNEVWAVYNRSILELEKNPIKKLDDVVKEDELE